MIPPTTDGEPNSTAQIPWPTAGSKRTLVSAPSNASSDSRSRNVDSNGQAQSAKKLLSTWDLITLSISMAGAQIAWTVELGYGTPFLLSLGLSEHITSLVWLAGPISGLIAQPVIGALSDSSPSKYRRRYWIILSTIALVVSTFTLAYCQEIASFFIDSIFSSPSHGQEEIKRKSVRTAIGFAVVSFYILDFALNGLQASLRNLLLDITPPEQLSAGNAWHGRMTNAGNIIGFGFGFLPLDKLPVIRLLGGGQFRKFCVICIIILVITVWMTCFFHEEQERSEVHRRHSTFRDVLTNIRIATLNLPKQVRRVCFVQLCAFMGWFPFLFYSTTYMGQVMAYELQREPDPELATRKGEFAMLLYSIVGVVFGTLLPHLANRDRRLMDRPEDVDEDAEISRLRDTVRQWRAEALREGKPLRLPVMPFLLRNIWTGALILFSFLTFSTVFITTTVQATIFISLVGICWAVAMWVPFAIIMEVLKDSSTNNNNRDASRRPSHTRVLSTPPPRRNNNGERQPLIRRRSFDDAAAVLEAAAFGAPAAGGTVLGIHNLAIVMPQLIVAVVTSVIFRIVDGTNRGTGETKYYGKSGVGWVLRFGGVCTLLGAALARMVAPTPTEKAMRRRLGEMKVLEQEGRP